MLIERLKTILFGYELACVIAVALYARGQIKIELLDILFGRYLHWIEANDWLFDRSEFAAEIVSMIISLLGL
jgi:hypothetical protein